MIIVERISPDGTAHRIEIGVHELIADIGLEDGGGDLGPDPHDLYDSALAACKALTMVWYAKARNIALETVRVGVERDKSEERAGVYRLRTRVSVEGPMSEAEREKLIDVATRCPIHKLMTQVRTEIETIAVEAA